MNVSSEACGRKAVIPSERSESRDLWYDVEARRHAFHRSLHSFTLFTRSG